MIGREPKRRILPTVFGMMIAVPTVFATSLIVAYPSISKDLDVEIHSIQLMVPIYFMSFAVAQVTLAPFADLFGKRRLAIVGLCAFSASLSLSGFTDSLLALLGLRVLQGCSAAMGMLVARSLTRDLWPPAEQTKIFASMNLVASVGPGLGPVIGGLLIQHVSWHSVFFFSAGMTLLVLAVASYALPVDARHPTAEKTRASEFINHYKECMAERNLLYSAVASGLLLGVVYAYTAVSANYYMNKLNFEAAYFGYIQATTIMGMWIGGTLIKRYGRTMFGWDSGFIGMGTCLAAAFVMSVAVDITPLGGGTMYVGFVLFSIGLMMVVPVLSSRALSLHGGRSAIAAGVFGGAQLSVASIASSQVSFLVVLFDDPFPFIAIELSVFALYVYSKLMKIKYI